jgi:hypothetical protein
MPKEKPWKFQAYDGSHEDIEFKFTPQSLELFEQGLPEQGYIGLLELEKPSGFSPTLIFKLNEREKSLFRT